VLLAVQQTICLIQLGYMKTNISGVEQLANYEGKSSHAKILVADAGAIEESPYAGKRVFFGAKH